MKQLVTPDPNIPCEPGWCLMYVRQTFGAPAVEPSATSGWENAEYKHEDYNWPNAWIPLWFSIDTIPEGHVVLRAPDGRIYSTSTEEKVPYVHPNLEHLIWFYKYYGKMELTYLGWSEDISNVRVVDTEEDDMFSQTDRDNLEKLVTKQANDAVNGTAFEQAVNAKVDEVVGNARKLVYASLTAKQIAEEIDEAGIAREVLDQLATLIKE